MKLHIDSENVCLYNNERTNVLLRFVQAMEEEKREMIWEDRNPTLRVIRRFRFRQGGRT